MLQDRQAAEDVVQESFAQAWRKSHTFQAGRAPVRSWLLAIVHHQCIDVLRHNASRPKCVTWEEHISPETDNEEACHIVETRQTSASLRSAVQSLPWEQRRVIELAYYGERSHSEIAKSLRIPLGTVKSRVRLGMGHLRTMVSAQACELEEHSS
jgi:RNA polymerase sigma-70 factor (ECF subfamily)